MTKNSCPSATRQSRSQRLTALQVGRRWAVLVATVRAGVACVCGRYSFRSCLRPCLLSFWHILRCIADVSPVHVRPQHLARHLPLRQPLDQRALVGWQLPQTVPPKANSLRRDAQRSSQFVDCPVVINRRLHGVQSRINLVHANNSTLVVSINLQLCFVYFLHLLILSPKWH